MKLEVGKTALVPEDLVPVSSGNVFGPTNGGNPSGGNNGGGNQGGNDGFKGNPFSDDNEFLPNKSRIGMWFLLLIVVMTFAGLMGAYIVIATNKGLEWKPFSLPFQVWLSSVVIIASSITFEIHNRLFAKGEQTKARNWMLFTAALGGVFIASQLIAWMELVRRGIYMAGNPYAGFFYILTGVHVVHVIGGIFAVGYMILKTKNASRSKDEIFKRQTLTTVISWYWHTIGGLWLVLFLLLGFWK